METTILNTVSEEMAEPLKRLLDGESYMDLKVGICPVGGSFDVVVSTMRPDTTEEELKDMVMMILAYHACGVK